MRYAQRIESCTLLDLEKGNLAARLASPLDGARCTLAHTDSGLAISGDPQRDALYWTQDAVPDLAEDAVDIEVAFWQVRGEGAGRRELTAHELTRPQWREFSGHISRVGSGGQGLADGRTDRRRGTLWPGVARRRA